MYETEECKYCSGTGRVYGEQTKECVHCEGWGYLIDGRPPVEEDLE